MHIMKKVRFTFGDHDENESASVGDLSHQKASSLHDAPRASSRADFTIRMEHTAATSFKAATLS